MWRSSGRPTNAQDPCDKAIRDRALGEYGEATMTVEILLEFGGFDIDTDNELIMVNGHSH